MKNTTNAFLKGMTSDMHSLTTSQQEYTDALNATLITFNGNEQMMQNDMGNTKIQDAKTGNIMGLREGFIPVGLKEHGGIMYIASVNKEGKGEIGTIPCPIITYKNQKNFPDPEMQEQDDHDAPEFDFTWAQTKDESPITEFYYDKINPEEIFILRIGNPESLGISSLTKKKLYCPHLIAINSKGEKDITPTVALSYPQKDNETHDLDYWFYPYNDYNPEDYPDLQVLNQPVEPSSEDNSGINRVNFLSFPKIESGKLGIKFTKEGIKEFSLAPNGKNGLCYPVLEYTEENGEKHYYSSIYGIKYITESAVNVDKLQFSYEFEDGSKGISDIISIGNAVGQGVYNFLGTSTITPSSFYGVPQSKNILIKTHVPRFEDLNEGDIIKIESNSNSLSQVVKITKYDKTNQYGGGLIQFEDDLQMLGFAGDYKFYRLESDSSQVKLIETTDENNTNISYVTALNTIDWPSSGDKINDSSFYLYRIDLGSDYNKWITLKIKYWCNEWEKELGEYTLTYNPYYMDTLGQFVVGKYYKIHTFSNGQQAFPQYRKYDRWQDTSKYTTAIGNGTGLSNDEYSGFPIKSDSEPIYSNAGFSDDLEHPQNLIRTSDRLNEWTFNINYTPSDIEDHSINGQTDYLMQYPFVKTVIDQQIQGIGLKIPVYLKEDTKYESLEGFSTRVHYMFQKDGNPPHRRAGTRFGQIIVKGRIIIQQEGQTSNVYSGSFEFKKENVPVLSNYTLKNAVDQRQAAQNFIDANFDGKGFYATEGDSYALSSWPHNNNIDYSFDLILDNTNSSPNDSTPVIWTNKPSDFPTTTPTTTESFQYFTDNEYLENCEELILANGSGNNEEDREKTYKFVNSNINYDTSDWFKWEESTLETNYIGRLDGTGNIIVQFVIESIQTKNLQRYSTARQHSLTLSLGEPELTIKSSNSSTVQTVVKYKSDCQVYPQVDAFVLKMDEYNNTIEVPACITKSGDIEEWNPICINYTDNKIKFNNIKSNSIPTGYTVLIDSDQSKIDTYPDNPTYRDDYGGSTFNLKGIEQYRTITLKKLQQDKFYILLSNECVRVKNLNNTDSSYESGQIILIHPKYSNFKLDIKRGEDDNQSYDNYFRSIGIYEILGNIAYSDDSESSDDSEYSDDSEFLDSEFITDLSNITVNKIPILDQLTQTVYCYAENREEIVKYFPGRIFTLPIPNSDSSYSNPEFKIQYSCSPIPEFGYQKGICLYEDTNRGDYYKLDENNNEISVSLFDENNSTILLRDTPDKSLYLKNWNIDNNTHELDMVTTVIR